MCGVMSARTGNWNAIYARRATLCARKCLGNWKTWLRSAEHNNFATIHDFLLRYDHSFKSKNIIQSSRRKFSTVPWWKSFVEIIPRFRTFQQNYWKFAETLLKVNFSVNILKNHWNSTEISLKFLLKFENFAEIFLKFYRKWIFQLKIAEIKLKFCWKVFRGIISATFFH